MPASRKLTVPPVLAQLAVEHPGVGFQWTAGADGAPGVLDVLDAGWTDAQLDDALARHDRTVAPPAPPPPVDPNAELHAAITAATTLDELKAALLGRTRPGAVRGVTPGRLS